MARKLTAITPGEILLMEFIKPLGISQSRLARDLSVPVRRVNDIVHGKRAITPDTALRLAVYFNMTPEFWLNLQSLYELRLAEAKTGKAIKKLPTLKHLEEAHA